MPEDTTNILVALKIMNISFENLKNNTLKLANLLDEVTTIKKEVDTSTIKTMRVVFLNDHTKDLVRLAHNRYKECEKYYTEVKTLYDKKTPMLSFDKERLKDANDIQISAKALLESSKNVLNNIIVMEKQIQQKIIVLPTIIDANVE